MVDDPSEHTDVLLSDPAKKRAATRELGKRREAWNRRRAAHEEALRQGNQAALDPGPEPALEECVADIERERLFEIIRHLVKWQNTANETVLQQARDEIWQSWRYACAANAGHPRARELFDRYKLPAFHDPFAGGGALPLEAQRLGLEAYASDLNPVAVLINKAMIEIPPKFAGRPPVNPAARTEGLFGQDLQDVQDLQCRRAEAHVSPVNPVNHVNPVQSRGAAGLAEDVRYYGKWMRDEAENAKANTEAFFLNGMTQAMHGLAEQAHPAYLVTIYYAFKQSESDSASGIASTGWDTFLDAVIRAGFAVNGTWPIRTELSNRMIGSGTNALTPPATQQYRPGEGQTPDRLGRGTLPHPRTRSGRRRRRRRTGLPALHPLRTQEARRRSALLQ